MDEYRAYENSRITFPSEPVPACVTTTTPAPVSGNPSESDYGIFGYLEGEVFVPHPAYDPAAVEGQDPPCHECPHTRLHQQDLHGIQEEVQEVCAGLRWFL